MRACADLAEQGRARRDESATQAALAAADDLAAWVDRMGGTPFTDHPYVATIPAERATWNAERSRLVRDRVTRRRGRRRPTPGPRSAARTAPPTQDGATRRPGCSPANRPPRSPARSETAAAAADGHVPLQTAIHALADRARIPLDTARRRRPSRQRTTVPYGLTERELLVLRLLVAGRSNGEIGAELFISRKTASVHVSNILRKLGVSNRAQAAALAERAGLVTHVLAPLARP